MNEYIIGLDFGNFYSQPCVIVGMDTKTRRGGVCHDLIDPYSPCKNGLPSIFYYSASRNNGQPMFGYQAERARPLKNGVRYMKRHLQGIDSEVLDGKRFTYDEMITATIQYCVREANKQLQQRFNTTSSLVALSCPAGISSMEKQRLVSLAEAATLADGRHVEIVGTIAEPAAAALDYEASLTTPPKEEVVMTYDLGGGTFDISLTKVYPNGEARSDGSVYYYDFIDTDGDTTLGGREFDDIMRDCIIANAGNHPISANAMELINNGKETLKRDLSYLDEVPVEIYLDDGFEIPPVKRAQFNERAEALVDRTIDMMNKMLDKPSNPRPDKIILCGGASQMPIVMEKLCAAFPEYKKDVTIISYNPSKAIAAGAARFSVKETSKIETDAVELRTVYDIGIRYLDDDDDAKRYIECFIPANTPIPAKSPFVLSHQRFEGQYTVFKVFEANKSNPDKNEPTRDYNVVCHLDYDNGKVMPAGTEHKSRIIIDKKGLLQLEVYDAADENARPQTYKCGLKNLK